VHFRYEAIGKSGRFVEGRGSADSIANLRVDLSRAGLTLVDARPDILANVSALLRPRMLGTSTLIDMFGFMRGLLGMGIDMVSAWDSVGDALTDRMAKEACSTIQASIRAGHSLSTSMDRAGVFPAIVLGNVRAGEESGKLEKVFGSLEEAFRQQQALRQQVLKATMYPLISLVVLFFIGVGLLTGVVPQLRQIFPPNPPLPTRILVFLSDSVVGYWWMVPIGIITTVLLWWRLPESSKMRVWEIIYRLPVLGAPLKNVLLANTFDNVALMLDSGVALTMTIRTVAESVTSPALRSRLLAIVASIEKGGRLSDGFRDPFFPAVTAGVIGQGEMVGSIDAYFRRLSGFFRDRAQARLLTLSTLLEPLLLLVGGGMLMLLAVGIFLPIYGQMKRIGR
jgi:type II secretory pathway component PulF